MGVREIAEQHQYPAWLLRFPGLIFIHYSILRILFLRSRVCRRALENLLLKTEAKGLNILDAGCGEGQYIIPLAAKNPHMIFHGIDQLPDHILFLKKLVTKKNLVNCSFEKADITTYLSNASSYDLIYFIGVLQYISDPGKIIQRAYQSQPPGGRILIYTPVEPGIHFNFYKWIRNKYGHYDDVQQTYNPLEEAQLYEWISRSGYRIIHKEHHYGTAGTLGHEMMQSLIMLITHWPGVFKIIPGVFFIILIPIFVSLQIVDTLTRSRDTARGNGLLLILKK